MKSVLVSLAFVAASASVLAQGTPNPAGQAITPEAASAAASSVAAKHEKRVAKKAAKKAKAASAAASM